PTRRSSDLTSIPRHASVSLSWVLLPATAWRRLSPRCSRRVRYGSCCRQPWWTASFPRWCRCCREATYWWTEATRRGATTYAAPVPCMNPVLNIWTLAPAGECAAWSAGTVSWWAVAPRPSKGLNRYYWRWRRVLQQHRPRRGALWA